MQRRDSLKKMFAAVFGGIAALIMPKKVEAHSHFCPFDNDRMLEVTQLKPLRCRVTFELDEMDKCKQLLKVVVPQVYEGGFLKYYTMSRKNDRVIVEWEHKLKNEYRQA